jgi:hypothetical protein
LIQKKQDLASHTTAEAGKKPQPLFQIKSILSRPLPMKWTMSEPMVRTRLVYLTWTTLFVSAGISKKERGSTRFKDLPHPGVLPPYGYLRTNAEPN